MLAGPSLRASTTRSDSVGACGCFQMAASSTPARSSQAKRRAWVGRRSSKPPDGISVLLQERPVFTTDPSYYRAVGLEPSHAKIVVVKSALQFRDGYGEFARAMWVVDMPGPSTANLG